MGNGCSAIFIQPTGNPSHRSKQIFRFLTLLDLVYDLAFDFVRGLGSKPAHSRVHVARYGGQGRNLVRRRGGDGRTPHREMCHGRDGGGGGGNSARGSCDDANHAHI